MNTPVDINWTGRWRNEYGSVLVIADVARETVTGTFETALGDSAFAGHTVPVHGVHRGPCLQFAFVAPGEIASICSFTGLLRDGRLHAAWHVVSDAAVKPPRPGAPAELMKLPWAHAVLTNSDTFVREEPDR